MTERGVFAVDRGVFDHPVFAPEPFTEREAWLWLIGAAAWKSTRLRTSRGMTAVERGQLIHSERFLATKFRWSKSRVHRYLLLLKSEAMVDLQTDHETNRITICNYERFAFDGTAKRTADDLKSEPPANRQRTKEEELKEGKKEEKELRTVAVATRPPVAEPFDIFWKEYPRRDGANPKSPAKKLFVAAVKGGADPAAIIEGARRCATAEHEKIGTPYIPQAVKWLRDRRWEDYAAGPPTAGLSDDERKRKFEELRNGGSDSDGKNLQRIGAGPRALDGPRREEPTKPTDDKARHAGMVRLGGLFQAPSGFRAIRDDASEGGAEPGNDSTGQLARPV